MHTPIISIIVAIQKNDRALGYQNELLYKIREDHKRFKEITSGHPIIMGRKTFESIGRPLPNRTNIVITRNKDWCQEGVLTVSSLEEAVEKAREVDTQEIFVIGGGEIYTLAIPFTDRLYLTVVDGNKPADTYFPPYGDIFIKKIESSEVLNDPDTNSQYQHLVLEK